MRSLEDIDIQILETEKEISSLMKILEGLEEERKGTLEYILTTQRKEYIRTNILK